MKLLVFIFCLLLVTPVLGATVYYVTDSTNADPITAWGDTASDGAAGTSWSTAWASIGKVNSGMSAGDTVYFGTGIYRDARLDIVSGTSPSARAAYACSALAAPTAGGSSGYFARLFASTDISGGWSAQGGDGKYAKDSAINGSPNFFTGDFFLEEQGSGAIAAGQWWTDGVDSTVIWLPDSSDPTTSYIEASAGRKSIRVDGQDWTTIFGLDVRYGDNRNIESSVSGGGEDSIFIHHCRVGPCAGDRSSNPGNIYSGTDTTAKHENWEIVACSLGGVYALNGTSLSHTHGGSIMTYSQEHMLVDSCWFFGYHTYSAIYWKNDNGGHTYGMTVRNNDFTSTSGRALIRMLRGKRAIEIYGNTFHDHTGDGIVLGYTGETDDSGFNIYNNTFIDVAIPLETCADGAKFNRKQNIRFKYNVIYGASTVTMNVNDTDLTSPARPTVIDSNVYFSDDTVWSSGGCGGQSVVEYNITEWRALAESWDTYSTLGTEADNDFDNVGGEVYTRSGAASDMNVEHNGQTWTNRGRYQNAAATRKLGHWK